MIGLIEFEKEFFIASFIRKGKRIRAHKRRKKFLEKVGTFVSVATPVTLAGVAIGLKASQVAKMSTKAKHYKNVANKWANYQPPQNIKKPTRNVTSNFDKEAFYQKVKEQARKRAEQQKAWAKTDPYQRGWNMDGTYDSARGRAFNENWEKRQRKPFSNWRTPLDDQKYEDAIYAIDNRTDWSPQQKAQAKKVIAKRFSRRQKK